ncbi:sensor histidine kinase [Desulfovibrio inopinatus]|uniref:sensor histidine kinase n=1 Tax=Desulfovibrio inopinatus TaxID=102109 RepID=UPI0003FDA9B4|nr:PAS domain-containing sensor histidine kinase [Desulfovibrio inopinatus]
MKKQTRQEISSPKNRGLTGGRDGGLGAIARTLFGVMIILPLVPLLLLLTIGFTFSADNLKREAVWRLHHIALDHGRMLDAFLHERINDLDMVAALENLPDLADRNKFESVFKSLKNSKNAFVDMGLIDPTGQQVAYAGPLNLRGRDYANSPWRIQTLARGALVSDSFLGHRGAPHFIVAIAGQGDASGWVLRATIDNEIFDRLVESFSLGATGEAYVMDLQGRLQTRRKSSTSLMDITSDFSSFPPIEDKLQDFVVDTGSGTYLYSLVPVNESRWRLVVRQEEGEAFEPLRRVGLYSLVTMVLGGVFILATAWPLSRRLHQHILRVVSEKEQLQEQLFHAGRLAEIGEMAAGIAHEINNPLQTMKSELTLMDMDMGDIENKETENCEKLFDGLRESMAQLEKQINRCAKITTGILKFGRYGEPERASVNIQDVIDDTLNLVEKQTEVSGITLAKDIQRSLPNVYCDPGQLQQVLLNLLNNARDAVLEQHPEGGGKIELRIGQVSPSKVQIIIGDNGIGMTEEIKDKAFSPFFTTKPVGKGTGLGLSICYGIIQTMGGSIDLDSTSGQGTVFTIALPIA